MNPDTQDTFAEMVDQFLERYCLRGPDLHVSDRQLFAHFRMYWLSTAQQSAHPALLGQYRVELTERGYRSRGGKRPRWYGLSLQIDEAPLVHGDAYSGKKHFATHGRDG
jgi:hypothetical protein